MIFIFFVVVDFVEMLPPQTIFPPQLSWWRSLGGLGTLQRSVVQLLQSPEISCAALNIYISTTNSFKIFILVGDILNPLSVLVLTYFFICHGELTEYWKKVGFIYDISTCRNFSTSTFKIIIGCLIK